MQDQVKEILASLREEWFLGELLSLRDGLEARLQRQNQAEPQHYQKADASQGTWSGIDVDEYLRQERGSWVDPTYEDVMAQARLLSDEEQIHLLRELEEYIEQEREKEASRPPLDLRKFRGIGHGIWEEVGGVDEFLKQERASWDD